MNLMSAPAVFDPLPSSSARVGRPWLSALAADSAYVLTGWVIAVISFSVLVSLLASGIGTLVVGVGFPVLVLGLFVAQGFALLERTRLRTLTGAPVLEPAYRPVSGGSVVRRVLSLLSDGRRWLDLLFGIVVLVPSLFVFPIGLAWWAVAVTGVLYPLYDWALPHGGQDGVSLAQLVGLGDSTTARVGLVFVIGLGAALTLPVVMRGLAMFLSSFGRAMLTRQRASVLAERVSALTESRAAAVSAEATALRRLERDLHDGPQQRLIRLAMDLGTAQRRLRTDPESAGPLISGAIEQTRETLDELRALSRGIAPPVLADRGLPAALASLAARCPVPVELQTEQVETPRLAPAVENAAYFLVAEALTNVVKHSGASAAAVLVSRDEYAVRVTVSDNGGGGAHPAKGHGLAGLLDRARALDGQLVVDSPPGGPTVLAAELPLHGELPLLTAEVPPHGTNPVPNKDNGS
ncbi:MAG TPA: sensor domain-containing protein [Pseudonocardia sp.]|jgi:signal transduction histidine kinase|nr:sensor domain-containing protein [Pseudonocardia sp.]